MSATKDKLKKRRPRKVSIEGDDFFVVSQTLAESEHVEALAKDESRGGEIISYSLSVGVVDEDGTPVFDQTGIDKNPGEFDPDIRLIPIETAVILSQKIREVTTPQAIEVAKKN